MSAHAFLAPSGAGIWGPGGCPAYPRMAALYPENEESPEAMEGTAAHFYVTEMLNGREHGIGTLAPNGHPIDREMIDCGRDFLTDVWATQARTPGNAIWIENKVSMIALIHALNWGTPDVYMLVWATKHLTVWDYKYGHRPVDAFKCWQLIDYAVGVLECEGVPMREWDQWTITLKIAQPRCYHPKGAIPEWTINGAELVTLANMLAQAARDATDPEAPTKTGEYCLDCSAVTHCPAAMDNAFRLVDISRSAQPFNLPPHALGLALAIFRGAEQRIKAMRVGLEEEALAGFASGKSYPLWAMEPTEGREKWNIPDEQVFALGDMYGVETRKPPSPITPGQARKAGVDADMVHAVAGKPRGAPVLVPFDDDTIAKAFS